MKRILFLIGVLLLSHVMRAQSVSYACRYWFDQNQEQMVMATACNNLLQMELDASPLSPGIHLLFIQVKDSTEVWCPPQQYMFYKPFSEQPANLDNVVYHCWFDEDTEHIQSGLLGTGQFLLSTDDLAEGIHLLYVNLESSSLTTTKSFMFYKAFSEQPANLDDVVYHCWFDEDTEHIQSGLLGTGQFLLNADDLAEGLHLLYVNLESSSLTTTKSFMFYKAFSEQPANLDNVVYHCWFDHDYSTVQIGLLGNGIFELDTEALAGGIHILNVQLDNGTLSAPQHYMFYKKLEREQIARWEYWLNDDVNNRHTTNFSPCLDSLRIISLLPIETWPVRSTCFHFHPNGDEPYLNAKNKISFKFWSTQCHFIEESRYYIDENIIEPIVADTLERNTTVSIPVPRDNQIHWFKLAANRGDYLTFQANKACTMQLFAPSGDEIYSVSGPESIQETGFNVWEDGICYLAVHDANGSEDSISITYNWFYRYAVLAYDVHLVGNGGCSTITFQGNGFNSLLDAYLVNYQNDTIRQLDIGHESNTTTTISFNFYEENLGAYDAVFEFFEETIRINGALEVQEPVDILLTSSVSYPSVFLRNTPCTYTYTVTNNGNMYAYAVPIFVYIASPTLDGISHIEFDGLDLPSIIDDVDLDSLALSLNEMMEFKVWAEAFGDDHYFIKTAGVDEATGDSVVVRSNFFFLNLAPFETKTLTLKITSNEPIDVWMTVPNEIISPITFTTLDDSRGFCCIADKIGCVINVTCDVLDWVSFFGSFGGQLWMQIASCVCSLINGLYTSISVVVCRENPQDFWGAWHGLSLLKTASSGLVSCLSGWLNFYGYWEKLKKIKEILTLFSNAFNKISMGESSLSSLDCFRVFQTTKPECIEGNPQGGKASAVNSLDPNDIHGYLSESGSHYMRQEIQNVQYEIEFENDTTLATAAAHTIIVRDTLDATKFDLNSLAARSVTIGDKRLDLNGEQTFARTLDLRPELYVIAQVEQDYDPTTGIIQWTIQSLDPMTMEPTNDPNQGVLPVNYYGNGVGFIDYSIDIKETFADGTTISNRAGIIFDQEDVIMTPTWTNIVDAVKPTSYIENVTFEADTLNFNFVSSDNRSGVWYHTLYYRNDSTDMQWQVKKPQIIGNDFMLRFNEYQTTEYLVMAVDSAGNVEEKEMVAEYVHYYDGPAPVCQSMDLSQGWNWISTYIDINEVNGLAMLEEALGEYGVTIATTDDIAECLGDGLWIGLEDYQWTNSEMIMVETSVDCTVTLEGPAVDPGTVSITIHPGWNWIGFPVESEMCIEEALAGFEPQFGDGIASFEGLVEYIGEWTGDFETLKPGRGYMYYSASGETKTLILSIAK